jgi:hypothetical protein
MRAINAASGTTSNIGDCLQARNMYTSVSVYAEAPQTGWRVPRCVCVCVLSRLDSGRDIAFFFLRHQIHVHVSDPPTNAASG